MRWLWQAKDTKACGDRLIWGEMKVWENNSLILFIYWKSGIWKLYNLGQTTQVMDTICYTQMLHDTDAILEFVVAISSWICCYHKQVWRTHNSLFTDSLKAAKALDVCVRQENVSRCYRTQRRLVGVGAASANVTLMATTNNVAQAKRQE